VLAIGALPTATPCARLHARNIACEWGLHNLADTIELVVSELVTNAVKASMVNGRTFALGAIGAAGVPVQLALAGRAVASTGSATEEASQSGIVIV
jgi:hypothetical protein